MLGRAREAACFDDADKYAHVLKRIHDLHPNLSVREGLLHDLERRLSHSP
jgi:hypothetical protein